MPESDHSPIGAHRHHAAGIVHERDELLRVLEEHIPEFIHIRDVDGGSVYASPSVQRVFGHAATTLVELAHPDDRDAAREWWSRIRVGRHDRLEWRIGDGKGDWRWLETSATPVPYLGRPHVLTISRDVTERKQA